MSASANWSYTSTATHWAQAGFDDWTGVKTWAAPVAFACDYKAEAKTMTDQTGQEFVSRQVLYTEQGFELQGVQGHALGGPVQPRRSRRCSGERRERHPVPPHPWQ